MGGGDQRALTLFREMASRFAFDSGLDPWVAINLYDEVQTNLYAAHASLPALPGYRFAMLG
jgi:hypothetical protein